MGEMLTLEEVASRLKIKAETVRRLYVKKGILPAVKLGRRWRIDADDLHFVFEKQHQPDSWSIINHVIAPEGLCTSMSVQDQLERETEGQPFLPPRPAD